MRATDFTRRQFVLLTQLLTISCKRTDRGYGKMSTSFSDPEWREAVERLLWSINTFRQSTLGRVKVALSESDVVKVAGDLAMSKYQPEDWFKTGQVSETAPLRVEQPKLDATADYRLLTLTALEEPASRVSMQFGGIAFEDPFYAILACFNFGTYRSLLILPRVSSVDRAWERRKMIVDALVNNRYRPEAFFAPCTSIPHHVGGLPFRELAVRGDLLRQIRAAGRGNIPDPSGVAKYALYAFAPES